MDLDGITPDVYRALCVLFGVLLGFIVAFRVRLYRSTYERQLGDLTAGLRLLDGRVQTVTELVSEHSDSLAIHDETVECHARRLIVVEDTVFDLIPPAAPRASRAPITDPSPKVGSIRPRCDGCGREGGDAHCYGARCSHCGGKMTDLDGPQGPRAA